MFGPCFALLSGLSLLQSSGRGKIAGCFTLIVLHLRKPRVLTPLRSLRTCVRNEVELVPLACEDDCPLASAVSCLWCSVSLPHGVMGWGAVCNCGISWSHLFIFEVHYT